MFRKILLSTLLFLCGVLASSTYAQTLNDIKNVNVEQLSDAQLQKINKEISNKGLTIEQAMQVAKAKGASTLQINQLKMRLQQQTHKPADNTEQAEESKVAEANEKTVEVEEIKKEEKIKSKQFGHSIFNSEKLTFQPDVNIPVPSGYTVSIGDEIRVTVWGTSEQSYFLKVDKNGKVNIPGVGLISVAGRTFSKVEESLKNSLTSIYSDMSGVNPTTFADISIGATQTIQVNILGEATMPGTYSLPATASVFNALYLSGGPSEIGSFRDIQVIRNNKVIKTIDVYDYLIKRNLNDNITLRNQDIIFIPTYNKQVVTSDNFNREAIFELKDGETLSDLLLYAGGLKPNVYSGHVKVERLTDSGFELATVNKEQFSSFQLHNGDSLFADVIANEFANRVSIEGAVYREGKYELKQGMTLSELIKLAGGVVPDYFANRGVITRLGESNFPTIISFDVKQVLEGSKDINLQREDKVLIKSIYDIGEQKKVRIEGEVIKEGDYPYNKNMTMQDLIFLAGGLRESASESTIEVARRRNKEESELLSAEMVTLFTFDIDRSLELTSEDKRFVLEPFDYVYVRRMPSYEEQKTVTLKGEVKYPGVYVIKSKDERISDLIARAGGLTDQAFVEAAYMSRGMTDRMKEVLQNINKEKQAIDSDLETNISLGKSLELRMDDLLQNPGGVEDYLLKEGDVITVPVRNEEVWVTGAVLNSAGLAYQGNRFKKYVDASGGFAKSAKKNKSYVIYPNGRSSSTKGFIVNRYPKVIPGSQIVVPLKPEREGMGTQAWVSIAATVTSMTVTVVALFK